MEEKYEAVKITLRDDMRLIADLDKKVKMLNKTAFEASNALETLENEYQSLLSDHSKLVDDHQHSILCLNQLTKRCETLQEDKRRLEEEVYRLQVRAAAGFEELTPRPSFAGIYEALGTEQPIVTRTEDQVKTLEKLLRAIQRKASRPRLTRKAPSPDSRDSTPKS
jgi:chromosome segregation ATPase